MKWHRHIALALSIMLATVALTIDLHAAQVLFTPQLNLMEEYSDNIFLSHEDEQEDFMTMAGLTLTLGILERNAGLELSYNPSFTFFADNSDQDYWRHAARLNAWYDVARSTRLELTNAYLESEEPLNDYIFFASDDPLAGPIIGTDLYRRERARYRTNTAEATLSHQFGIRDRVHVAMRYELWKDIDERAQTPLDYSIYQPSFGLAYWFTQKWGTEVEGYYSNRNYDNRIDRQEFTGFIRQLYALTRNLSTYVEYRHTRMEFDEGTGDYHVFYPSAGFRYEFEETAYLRIGAGYYIQDFDNAGKNEDWNINSELYKRWNYRTGYVDARGASGYGIADTDSEDFGFTIFYEGRLGTGYNFSPGFSGNAYVSYRHNDYQEPDRSDSFLDAGLGLRYLILQWMELGLRYRFRDFDSDIATAEYTENRITLTINLIPTIPYRWN